MRYGVISDIHGNLEALEAALESLSRETIDAYLCVGDLVGYGADPAECIKRIRALNPAIVSGNHDAASAGLHPLEDFNDMARQAVIWASKNIEKDDIEFLKSLDLVYKNEHLIMAHGTLYEPEKFHYMLGSEEALSTFELMDRPLCFVGHSHIPGAFIQKDGKLDYYEKNKIKLNDGEKAIVNAGSVGQPRDGDRRLCCAIYDTDKNLIEFKRLSYDIEKAQSKILKKGLPPFLAYRLSQGA